MNKRNVVVTGLGTINGIGNNVDEFWSNAKKGVCGLSHITLFDPSLVRVKVVCEVKGFDPLNYMDIKRAKRMERFSQFAVVAANEAIKDSGLDFDKEDRFRVGVCVGSGIGSIEGVANNALMQEKRGPRGIHPLVIPMIIPNMASAHISIVHGLHGKNINVSTACASSNNCLGEALRTIQYGDADIMIAGGAEAEVTPLTLNGFSALSALCESDDPNRASIPFDKERSGFVMGEGAGVVVLEEEEHAKKRGAKIYARLLGYGTTCDAFHMTAPSDDKAYQSRCMRNAIDDAGLKPEDIDYVNAHGTSTKYNDLYETNAIKDCFGEHAAKLKISSTKSMVGHLLGACGGVEMVAVCKTIQEGIIHQTVNYKVPDPELDLDYVVSGPIKQDVRYVISNCFAFGGHNTTIVAGKY